jgi:hypothetical protein
VLDFGAFVFCAVAVKAIQTMIPASDKAFFMMLII